MSRRSPITLLVCFLVGAVAGPVQAQTTLRYQYKEGETIPYTVDQNMKMSMNIAGKDLDITMDMGMEILWKVKKVHEDGKAEMGFKFTSAKVTMDTPMGKVAVSSNDDNEPDDQIGQIMYKMVKGLAKIEMTGLQSPTGELTDVKIPDKALAELKKLAAAGGPAGNIFTADSLKSMVGGSSGLVLSKDPVSKGKSWSHKTSTKTEIGDTNVNMKYTYEGSKDELATISLKPSMEIKPKEDSPIAMKIKSAEGKGKALFDNKAGQLREITMTQVIDMEAEVMGMAFSQKMTIDTKMKLGKMKSK